MSKTVLINAIITAYHTTRLSGVTVTEHVLSKDYVQKAFEKYDEESKDVSKQD